MTFKHWFDKNLGVDEDGNLFFWRDKLGGRVRSAISFTEFEECWDAAIESTIMYNEMEPYKLSVEEKIKLEKLEAQESEYSKTSDYVPKENK
jgi:hypothetical protein